MNFNSSIKMKQMTIWTTVTQTKWKQQIQNWAFIWQTSPLVLPSLWCRYLTGCCNLDLSKCYHLVKRKILWLGRLKNWEGGSSKSPAWPLFCPWRNQFCYHSSSGLHSNISNCVDWVKNLHLRHSWQLINQEKGKCLLNTCIVLS